VSAHIAKFTNKLAASTGLPRPVLRRVFQHASHEERARLYRNPSEVEARARAAIPPEGAAGIVRKAKPAARLMTAHEKIAARVRAVLGRPKEERILR
jgi:hypothetical protein